MDLVESIFEVIYKLESFDLLIDGDFQMGPIYNYSTLSDLTHMVNIINKNNSFIFIILIILDANNSIR